MMKRYIPERIQEWLVRFAHWILRQFDKTPTYPLPRNITLLVIAAERHIQEIEEHDARQAPDWKLFQARARMIQQFPKVRARWIDLAMSLAYCFEGDHK